jgi:hypothetical protein
LPTPCPAGAPGDALAPFGARHGAEQRVDPVEQQAGTVGIVAGDALEDLLADLGRHRAVVHGPRAHAPRLAGARVEGALGRQGRHLGRPAGDGEAGQPRRLRQAPAGLHPRLDLRQLDPRRIGREVELGPGDRMEQAAALRQQALRAGPVLPVDRGEHLAVVVARLAVELLRRALAGGVGGEVLARRLRLRRFGGGGNGQKRGQRGRHE